MKLPTVGEMFPTRRKLLEFGGWGLAGALAHTTRPLHCSAGEKKVKPRTARARSKTTADRSDQGSS